VATYPIAERRGVACKGQSDTRAFPETVFAASHWPWWQITVGTDALLTGLLLYFADAARPGWTPRTPGMNRSFWAPCPLASFLRGAFSLATFIGRVPFLPSRAPHRLSAPSLSPLERLRGCIGVGGAASVKRTR
jgi:hypothetical protein